MRVLVFEPGYRGHRLATVRRLIQALKLLPVEITLVTGQAAPRSDEWTVQLDERLDEVTVDASVRITASSASQWGWQSVREVVAAWRRHSSDHVLIPFGDGIAQIYGLLSAVGALRTPPGLEIEGLMLRGGFGYPTLSRRERLMRRISATAAVRVPWIHVYHLDPTSAAYLQGQGGDNGRFQLMPDAVEVSVWRRRAARRELAVPEDGRYVVCAGRLDGRKGVDRLIAAFADARLSKKDRLLLIGLATPEIRHVLDADPKGLLREGRILCVDRYVSNETFGAALGAADLVCAPYPAHQASASIVIAAAAAGRPTLGSNTGWIGRTVPALGLGWTTPVEYPDAFARALERSLDAAMNYRAGQRARRFVQFHSVDNMQATWTQRVRERLSWPEARGRHSWNWVLAGESAERETIQ